MSAHSKPIDLTHPNVPLDLIVEYNRVRNFKCKCNAGNCLQAFPIIEIHRIRSLYVNGLSMEERSQCLAQLIAVMHQGSRNQHVYNGIIVCRDASLYLLCTSRSRFYKIRFNVLHYGSSAIVTQQALGKLEQNIIYFALFN